MSRQKPGPGVLDALFGPVDPRTGRPFGQHDEAPADHAATVRGDVGLRDLRWSDLVAVGKSTIERIGEDRVTYVSGGVTFFGLLSLFPAITAFVSVYGLMADPAMIEGHLSLLSDLLPEGGLQIISTQVNAIASNPAGVLSLAGLVALIVALWSANGGTKALLSALNVAFYQRETRSFLKFNLVSMVFTLSGLALIAVMFSMVAVIPALLRWVPMAPSNEMTLNLIRWPIMFAVLILALAAIYRWGPSRPSSRWRWVSPGAVLAGIALVVTSILFSWYAANFGNYNETYGALGAVIALMTWLWLNATIVLVGAELNSELERHLRRMAGLSDPKAEALKAEIARL
ncbi:YihY/virulence factor BrkB family protein [Paracoccus bogoriensis]|uniref:YihY/virulence factor BrkB family protein n=1 Tax=Paracoccus bogoriensis TaxID=242065 RepID=UPI001C663450|nr:YihY/virulence factor BrkB family protein [Paracoccus bogoriensis]MBW7057199.1 YihY/virulence factor BrkB family protein [Paracoccus bogoriensis]